MNYNDIAKLMILELKGYNQSDQQIATKLSISRQALHRRKKSNTLTTNDITILAEWIKEFVKNT